LRAHGARRLPLGDHEQVEPQAVEAVNGHLGLRLALECLQAQRAGGLDERRVLARGDVVYRLLSARLPVEMAQEHHIVEQRCRAQRVLFGQGSQFRSQRLVIVHLESQTVRQFGQRRAQIACGQPVHSGYVKVVRAKLP